MNNLAKKLVGNLLEDEEEFFAADFLDNAPPNESEYDRETRKFLEKNRLGIKIAHGSGKSPLWSEEGAAHGNHYRITIFRRNDKSKRISFDFWGSIAAAEKGEDVSAYDIFFCIGNDANCAETFEGFCNEYGYDDDNRKAERMFRACNALAIKLRAFFTEEEIMEMSQIQ